MVLIALVAITTTVFFTHAAHAEKATSQVLGFQGRLLDADGANVPDGYYNVQFKIYQGGTGKKPHNPNGTLVWKESYRNTKDSQGVKVTKGRFSVNLGSIKPLTDINWSSGTLWLSLNIAGSSANCSSFGASNCQSDGEMLPMTQITSTPHALDSSRLDGKSSSDYVQLGQGVQTDNNAGKSSIHINKTSSGDLLQLQKDSIDVMTVSGEGDITLGSNKSSHSISIGKASDGADGSNLTVAAGDGSSGGTLTLSGGRGADGASGLVVIDTPAYSTTTDDEGCFKGGVLAPSSCTFSSSSLNNSAVLVAGFSTTDQTATLPDPIIKTAGRIMYVTAHSKSQPFSLALNQTRATKKLVPMEGNDTVSLLWSGSDWTVAGQAAKQTSSTSDSPDQSNDDSSNDTSSDIDTSIETSGDAPSEAPIGSLYYDTKLGELRCYESEGWGPCSNSPDEFVSLSPEYSNAVIRQTGKGEMTTDTCSDSLHINDGTSGQDAVCGEDETFNYYNWTTDEYTPQARSIFITYKLSDDFKEFVPKSTSLMAMVDDDEASVDYQIYRKHDGGKLTACGDLVETEIENNNSWNKLQSKDDDDPSKCDFKPGDSIVFEVNLSASNNANAYISDLDFVIRNQRK